jgi:type I restriction enzyme, S subunit
MDNWRTITLGQLCAAAAGGIQTGPFGSQLHAGDYVMDGVPSVMPQNIGDNRIDPTGIARVSAADMDRLRKYQLEPGDIVYSRRGDVERRALVRTENAGWLCGTGCLRVRIPDQSAFDSRFVSYALGLAESRAWIVRHAVGATMLNLNTSILGGVPLRVPRVDEQRAVAEVLEALDDKIAANDRVLVVLDDLVRSMFERLVGGTIPLSAVAKNIRKQVNPGTLAGTTPYVGLEHIPRRRMWLTEHATATTVTSAKSEFQLGDVLFGKLRPYFHKVVHAPFAGVVSTDVLVLRAKDSHLAGYVLAAAASDHTVRTATAASEGTRMPRTSWADLGAVEMPWPGDTAACVFSADVAKMAGFAATLSAESATLASARDELLPLLMSGRLRVKDAEKVVEETL